MDVYKTIQKWQYLDHLLGSSGRIIFIFANIYPDKGKIFLFFSLPLVLSLNVTCLSGNLRKCVLLQCVCGWLYHRSSVTLRFCVQNKQGRGDTRTGDAASQKGRKLLLKAYSEL